MSKAAYSVTDCFREQLKTLYLNHFPCYRDTKIIEKYERQVNLSADEYHKEELLDILGDKKSPWYQLTEWSPNGDSIRNNYVKNSDQIDLKQIEQYFTSLKFNEKNIEEIDRGVKIFSRLEELVVTCNQLRDCDASYLPNQLRLLDLSGNYLDSVINLNHRPIAKNIQHLGLSLNWLRSLELNLTFWSSLVSLDLSSNQFNDLFRLVDDLQQLKSLKVLSLNGNPIVLLPVYRGTVVDSLPKLVAFDDKTISKEERINYQDYQLLSGSLGQQAVIKVAFHQIKNLILPEIPEFDDEPEIFLYKYIVSFDCADPADEDAIDPNGFKRHKLHSIPYKNKVWKSLGTYVTKRFCTSEMDPAANIDFNEKGITVVEFKSLDQLRDYFLDGTDIKIIEKKIYYRLKDYEPPSATKGKGKKKEDKKADDSKKKKKKNPNFLDNYNVLDTEERVIASFYLDLASLLDGVHREIKKKFTVKLDVPVKEPTPSAKKKDDKKKKEAAASAKPAKNAPKSGANKKKGEPEITEPVEPPPLELDVSFDLFTLNSFKDLKAHINK